MRELNLCDEDEAALFDAIAGGRAARCLLPWMPLMHGGEEAGIIQRWIELAIQEAGSRRHGAYGGLALVFAEASRRLPAIHASTDRNQVLAWLRIAVTAASMVSFRHAAGL